jgi:hypothetical protein
MPTHLRSRLIHAAALMPKGDPTRQVLLAALREKTALDADQQRLYESLKLIAENDGRAYQQKDAPGAVTRAFTEWKASQIDNFDYDFKAVRKSLVKDLNARWRATHR